MGRPRRRVIPGTTYLLTKKSQDGIFHLVPDDEVNKILLYALVVRALRYGVLVHGFVFMSNHFHLVITDVRGRLPDFMRDFATTTSKALKEHLHEDRAIWSSSERYTDTRLVDLDAAERKLVYAMLNPVKAGLVAHPKHWPGLTSAKYRTGQIITAHRPDIGFGKRNNPETVEIPLTSLALPFDADGNDVERSVQTRAREATSILQALVTLTGGTFLGPQGVQAESRARRTRNFGIKNSSAHLFATSDLQLRLAAEGEFWSFQRQLTEAINAFRSGDRDVVFPRGTWGYRHLGVNVEDER